MPRPQAAALRRHSGRTLRTARCRTGSAALAIAGRANDRTRTESEKQATARMREQLQCMGKRRALRCLDESKLTRFIDGLPSGVHRKLLVDLLDVRRDRMR